MSDADLIQIDRDGPWRVLWLNRPDARNALSPALVAALRAGLAQIAADPEARGLTLRGRGGTFCAGGDLKGFKQGIEGGQDRAKVEAMSREGAALFDAVAEMPMPVIAVVEGAAMAGGMGMACAADLVVAPRGTLFGLSEVRIGLSPAQIAPFVLRRLGPAARRLMLTGARLTAEQGAGIGLVDVLTEDAAGLEAAEAALRADVLACAPGAVAETKALLRELPALDRAGQIDRAARGFAGLMGAPEAAEGLASFLERRKPAWATG